MTSTENKISEVVDLCKRFGTKSIIALAGVPGTGKSHVGYIAAQRFAGEPLRVVEKSFHSAWTYDQFIEGLALNENGSYVQPGVFLRLNEIALADPESQYVLLIEEFTRADHSAVLGELMTYLEHRDRPFEPLHSRRPVKVAKNIAIVVTYNPVDRSALDMDLALLRRLVVVEFEPDEDQLQEMLADRGLLPQTVESLSQLFSSIRTDVGPDEFRRQMPFGHGVFADVSNEADLTTLWHSRLKFMLQRPGLPPHPYADRIEAAYEWQ